MKLGSLQPWLRRIFGLQVLQKKCPRLVTNSDYKTPTSILLLNTVAFSVQQRIVHLSLSQVFNIHQTKKPAYHHMRLFSNALANQDARTISDYNPNRINFRLSMARSSFFYQSSRLWTALPVSIKSSKSKATFKKNWIAWIKENIQIKPYLVDFSLAYSCKQ